jgi:hypothetical protein
VEGCEAMEISPQVSSKKKQANYFQNNYEKFFRNPTEAQLGKASREPELDIYERSLLLKKQTEHKLQLIKRSRLEE